MIKCPTTTLKELGKVQKDFDFYSRLMLPHFVLGLFLLTTLLSGAYNSNNSPQSARVSPFSSTITSKAKATCTDNSLPQEMFAYSLLIVLRLFSLPF
jgi:hypothetical protein